MRSSASTIRIQGCVARSIAQFFCAADPKYSCCRRRTSGIARAISTVRSVEKESTSRTSSAKRTLSRHSWMLLSSLNEVTIAVHRGRSVNAHLPPLDREGLSGRFVHVDHDRREADVALGGLERPRGLGQELLDD